jgi:hypothetical protein
MSDALAFYRLFEKSPGDFAAYGAVADALDEDGWNSLAHAFRWMALRQKHPHKRSNYRGWHSQKGRKVPGKHRWAWYSEAGRKWNIAEPIIDPDVCRLPPLLIMSAEQKVFASHQAAVMWLAARLSDIGATYLAQPRDPLAAGQPLITVLREPPEVPLGEEEL